MTGTRAITVSVVNDYPVVVHGVHNMLSSDPRFEVIEVATSTTPDNPVDVVLFDAFAKIDREDALATMVADPRYGRVLIYSDTVDPPQLTSFFGMGVAGYVSKTVDSDDLADAIVQVHRGESVTKLATGTCDVTNGDWPGRLAGLSEREAEMIALITQGTTNQDIAATCFLSINSVKSYIRSAYRKIGVTRRSQAVLWGITHGMVPTTAAVEVDDSQSPQALG